MSEVKSDGVVDCYDQPAPSKMIKLDSPPTESGEKESILLDDPSEFRPEFETNMPEHLGKNKQQFRTFYETSGERYETVKKTYTDMHTQQTMESVKQRKEKWFKFDKAKMTIMEALHLLDDLVDESDPDTSEPNSVHAFQTAERVRQAHPDNEWFHLVGLIHDLGKVLAIWGEPQWAVVGDTFPVGCAFSDACVFPELFKDNPDSKDQRYNSECGVYEHNCGLDNVNMSFGHDEYLYQVLKANGCTLPKPAFYMIRYHSFYPWHSGGAYDHLCNDEDREMLKWVREFNKFDLYSKADINPDPEELQPYYQKLIDKFCPGELRW